MANKNRTPANDPIGAFDSINGLYRLQERSLNNLNSVKPMASVPTPAPAPSPTASVGQSTPSKGK